MAFALAFALVPATALAADPTSDQYGSRLDQISPGGVGAGGAGGSPGVGAGDSGATLSGLPFTGLDLALMAALAATLVVAGLLLLRSRRADSAEA
jgi:hypothetical protein